MTVGDRIKIAREAAGMTQEQLGKICGVTKQTIFKYENNIITNIPLDKLELISFGLNVSAAKLMDWETEDGGIDFGIAQYETGLSAEEVESLIDAKKFPGAVKTAQGEVRISLEDSNRLLVALGLIEDGQELSDNDLAFMEHIVGLLDTWFRKGH